MVRHQTPIKLAKRWKAAAYTTYFRSPLSKLASQRRAHIYCIGTAKSGTSSLASLYRGELRTYHEADAKKTIPLILGRARGAVGERVLREHLLGRDRTYRLEMDSSQVNYFCIPELLNLFPEAKFILTLRDPYAWLDSYINHQLSREEFTKEWNQLRDFRFGRTGTPHPPEESVLASKGLYTLDGYLAYWKRHNCDVLRLVPPSRLLVVRTHEITSRLTDIAEFVGIAPRDAIAMAERSHTNRARRKLNVLDEIDQNYLRQKLEVHCSDLARQFFPNWLKPLEAKQ